MRILAFAGGGFDTVMQLGVVHALLAARRAPPDMVIGCSAGSVNAVALAEVFQAGDTDEARVARFREIFEAYLQAPGRIATALRPDTFQVDTQRPLAPIELPIHQQAERKHRLEALESSAGLINLYNTLLTLHVTLGAATRAIRRFLAIKAAGNLHGWRRLGTCLVEAFRTWTLTGQNVRRAASVLRVLAVAKLRPQLPPEHGATAGELIFRWRWAGRATAWLVTALTALLVTALWVAGSLVVVGVATVGGLLVLHPLYATLSAATELLSFPALWEFPTAMVLTGLLGAVLAAGPVHSGWTKRLGRALVALASFVVRVIVFGIGLLATGALLAALTDLPVALATGSPRDWPWFEQWAWQSAAAAGTLVLAAIGLFLGALRTRKGIGEVLLARHGIAKAIFPVHPVRELLVGLFDPEYYGVRDRETVIDEALAPEPPATRPPRPADPSADPRSSGKKLLRRYGGADRKPAIHVAVTAADIAAGDLQVLSGDMPVVDGLLAAIAVPPILPPWSWKGNVLVDGWIVANEPTRPLFSFLRRPLPDGTMLLNPAASELHVYNVSAFPLGKEELGPEHPDQPNASYTSLVDIVARALKLRRLRDATLERRLIEITTRAMAPGAVVQHPPTGELPEDLTSEVSLKELFRTRVFAIEPERPLDVNAQIFATESDDERRRVVGETVAAGCRASLRVMLGSAFQPSSATPGGGPRQTVPCYAAVPAFRHAMLVGTKGSEVGPGLPEVCANCQLLERSTGPRPAEHKLEVRLEGAVDPESEPPPAALAPEPPLWPAEEETRAGRTAAVRIRPDTSAARESRVADWPRGDGANRPLVTFLFSGGVFRGVFQMGVLNALSEVHLRPDVIAGASVGSITAAMVARTYIEPDLRQAATLEAQRNWRRQRILSLAATYLGVNRLILTDRFADVVRTLTVRAAGAEVSIRDFDRVLRRYDEPSPAAFSRDLRRVVAGLERLLYVSPYELNELVEMFRRQRHRQAASLLKTNVQEWLDRMGVRTELLGAEPLKRLIRDHVLESLPVGPAGDVELNSFRQFGLCFLATATDITNGRLTILGEDQLEPAPRHLRLVEALLASSAFPGVFRPRWSWEVEPTTVERHQYIDGGVMDNLPVDAVAQFLHKAAKRKLISPRPGVPHLVVCASLEPRPAKLTGDAAALKRVRGYWPGLLRRAKQLGYNQKLDVYRRAQRNIRAVFTHREQNAPILPGDPAETMLSLEVESVIPKWLCGTFAFHPMLGFRRSDQAASIAHGCASTLLLLGSLANTRTAAAAQWGIRFAGDDLGATGAAAETFRPVSNGAGGACWFRSKSLCPFSAEGQQEAGGHVCEATGAALTEIHRLCGRAATHQAR